VYTKKSPRARGKTMPTGTMNGLESRYVREVLEPRRIAEDVFSYDFEAIKLRLAKKTFYTPDFVVVRSDGAVEFHEVKGFWEDDARVKIKVAAARFPCFLFVAAQHKKKQWQTEEF